MRVAARLIDRNDRAQDCVSGRAKTIPCLDLRASFAGSRAMAPQMPNWVMLCLALDLGLITANRARQGRHRAQGGDHAERSADPDDFRNRAGHNA